MATRNSMAGNDESDDRGFLSSTGRGATPPGSQAQVWIDSILGVLGVDRCCALAAVPGFAAQEDEDDPSQRPVAAAALHQGSPPTDMPASAGGTAKKSSGGWFSKVKVAFGGKTEEEKRKAKLDRHVALLKEGALFTHRFEGGKAPAPVWLQLTVCFTLRAQHPRCPPPPPPRPHRRLRLPRR
jgi:hypothetical protein